MNRASADRKGKSKAGYRWCLASLTRYATLKISLALSRSDNSVRSHPAPLEEVLAAVSYIRNNADKYHVNPNSISVMGFSAGGHLAASASCYYDDQEILNKLGLTKEDTKINGCFLCYPVISLEVGHEETFMNVSGGNKELLHKYSIEKNVSDKFPRTFIFHTTIDSIVNVENSLMLASKLHDHNIPFEMHIYPYCDHGLSLADSSVYPNDVSREYLDEMKPHSEWPRLALEFIKRYL